MTCLLNKIHTFQPKGQSCLISLQHSALFITPSFLSLLPPLASMTLLSSSFPHISLTIPSQPPPTALQPLFTSMASILLGFALQPLYRLSLGDFTYFQSF